MVKNRGFVKKSKFSQKWGNGYFKLCIELGNITDGFECNSDRKEAIYVTHVRPNIIDQNLIAEFQNERKEYCFIIDRSGSMSGSLMRQVEL